MQERRREEKPKMLHSFRRHLMEEKEGTYEDQKQTEEQPCMCMHTTNKTDRHIFFLCLVCDQQLRERAQQTEGPHAPKGLWIQDVKETDMTEENMRGKRDEKSGKYIEMKKDSEREKWISGLRDGRFWIASGMCERHPGETCKYVV